MKRDNRSLDYCDQCSQKSPEEEDDEDMILCSLCEQAYRYCCVGLYDERYISYRKRSRKFYLLCRRCSESRKAELFPSLGQVFEATRELREARRFRNEFIPHVYCDCGTTMHDETEPMVECNVCGEWYHEYCVKIDVAGIAEHDCFICTYCSHGKGHLVVSSQDFDQYKAQYDLIKVDLSRVSCPKREIRDNIIVHGLKRRMLGDKMRKSDMEAQLVQPFSLSSYSRFLFDEEPWAMTSIRNTDCFCVGTNEGNIDIYELKESTNGSSRIIDVENNTRTLLSKGTTITSCSGFAHLTTCPDYNKSLVFGSDWYDSVITVTDLEVGKEIYSNVEHTGPVRSFDYCSRVNCFLTSSFDKTIRLWNGRSGLHKSECKLMAHTGHVTGAAFLSDYHIATVSEDSTIKIWDMRMISEYGGENRGCIHCMDLYDLRLISLSLSDDRSVAAVNVDSGKILTFNSSELVSGAVQCPRNELVGHKSQNWSTIQATIIPGTHIVMCGSEDGHICCWHEPSATLWRELLHSGCVWSSCYLDPSNTIITASSDGSLCAMHLFGTAAVHEVHLSMINSQNDRI